MTQQEFDNTKFHGEMTLKYKGEVYDIASIDTEEKLIAFSTEFDEDLTWVRCENVEII